MMPDRLREIREAWRRARNVKFTDCTDADAADLQRRTVQACISQLCDERHRHEWKSGKHYSVADVLDVAIARLSALKGE